MIKLSSKSITEIYADVIVNSANPGLGGIGPDLPEGVGGVDGAIHRQAGQELFIACQQLPIIGKMKGDTAFCDVRCFPGNCVLTKAFNVNAQLIIHAVAPLHDGADLQADLSILRILYENIYDCFQKTNLKTILMPPLGTRSFGMPKDDSARIAVDKATQFSSAYPDKQITFSVIDPDEYYFYERLLHIR